MPDDSWNCNHNDTPSLGSNWYLPARYIDVPRKGVDASMMQAFAPTPLEARAWIGSGLAPEVVVIDLMGGLCPERDRVRSCLSMALSVADLPAGDLEAARLALLPTRSGLREWVASQTRLAPEVIRPLVAAVHEDFRERLLASVKSAQRIQTFPGAATLLAELGARDVRLAIDSELDGDLAAAFLERAGFSGRGWIDAVVGADEVSTPRPGPGQVEEAVRRCGCRHGARVVKVAAQRSSGERCDRTLRMSASMSMPRGYTSHVSLTDRSRRRSAPRASSGRSRGGSPPTPCVSRPRRRDPTC